MTRHKIDLLRIRLIVFFRSRLHDAASNNQVASGEPTRSEQALTA